MTTPNESTPSEASGAAPSLLESEDDGGGVVPAVDHYNPQDLVSSWLQEAFEKEDPNEGQQPRNIELKKDIEPTNTFSVDTSGQSFTDCEISIERFEPEYLQSGEYLEQYPEYSSTPSKQSRRMQFVILASALVLILALIAMTVAIIKQQNSSTGNDQGTSEIPPIATFAPMPPSTDVPSTLTPETSTTVPTTPSPTVVTSTMTPTSAQALKLKDLISRISFDGGDALSNSSSPQFSAFTWLASEPNLEQYSSLQKIQRYALATLYYSTFGEDWINADGWLSHEHECDWDFDEAPCGSFGEIIGITLGNHGLNGTIPPELGLLSVTVHTLNLRENHLENEIPSEIGLLSALEVLDLSQNDLAGMVPSELGLLTNLSVLNLLANGFSGTFPLEICGAIIADIQVDACGNLFCNCCGKWCLYLSLSAVSMDQGVALANGESPQQKAFSWLASNPNLNKYAKQQVIQRYVLSTLYYSTSGDGWNDRHGYLNDVKHECAWIDSWDPSLPATQGPTEPPIEMATAAPGEAVNLINIFAATASSFSSPEFSADKATDGDLSTRWQSESLENQWIAFYLGFNYMVSSVQIDWGDDYAIVYSIESSDDSLDWEVVFQQDAGTGGTETIELDSNVGNYLRIYATQYSSDEGYYSVAEIKLWGTLLPSRSLQESHACDANGNLQSIILVDNNLRGFVPQELALLSNSLRVLHLEDNRLEGLPTTVLGFLTGLEILGVGQNELQGTIPIKELAPLSNMLRVLELHDNEYEAGISTELSLLTRLELLDLGQNALEGSIPSELGSLSFLKKLDMAGNELTGLVPFEICDLSLWELTIDCDEVECFCCPLCE